MSSSHSTRGADPHDPAAVAWPAAALGGRVAEDDPATAALARGDRRAALSHLMQRYGGELLRFCAHMLGDPTLAEDVHQAVFVEAFECLDTYRGQGSWRSWLYGIARHRCLDAAKIRRRWSWRFSLAPDAGHTEVDPRADLDGSFEQQQRSRVMLECLRGLAAHVRVVVLLRYEQGLSYEDIARISHERPGTLQARVARALPLLRDCVTAKGVRL